MVLFELANELSTLSCHLIIPMIQTIQNDPTCPMINYLSAKMFHGMIGGYFLAQGSSPQSDLVI